MKKTMGFLAVMSLICYAGLSQAIELDFDNSDFGKIDIHGFLSQGILKSWDNNYIKNSKDGTFELNELGINFGTDLSDKLHLGLQLFSRDYGDVGNNKVVVDWAYADYRWQDWLGLRVGRIRLPLGLYNETRDVDMLRTNVLLPQSVYNEELRDNLALVQGLGTYGSLPLDALGMLNYQVLYGGLDVATDSGGAKKVKELYPTSELSDIQIPTLFDAQLIWDTPVDGLRAGVTYVELDLDMDIAVQRDTAMGPFTIPAGSTLYSETDLAFTVGSLEYTHNNLILAAEVSINRRRMLLRTPNPPSGPGFVDQGVFEPVGYYISGAYRFTDWFELGAYYSVIYQDKDDKGGSYYTAKGQSAYNAWEKDKVLSVRFDLSDNWVFKLEGHLIDGTANKPGRINSAPLKRNWNLVVAKVTYSF